jgi:hypothetical protein
MTTPGAAAHPAARDRDWTAVLPLSVRHVLAQMNRTLTLSEAKAELARHLIERRRAWEAGPRA